VREKMKVLSFALLIAAGMSLALPALAATSTVSLTADNKFAPANPSVSVGDTVEFKWGGGFHDVVFADGAKSGAPTDDTGVLYSRTFDGGGTFKYICTVHEALGMKGAITVAAASGDTTATTTAESLQMPHSSVLVVVGMAGLLIVRRLRA